MSFWEKKLEWWLLPARVLPFRVKEIINFLEELGIAKYKFPEDLRIIKELPRNPVGKVLRRELKVLFS